MLLILTLVHVFFIILALLIGGAFYQSERLPKNAPSKYLRRKSHDDEDEMAIVFMGDSITHGRIGVNYVEMVEERLKDSSIQFINAGVNSELAWNLLQRVDEVIRCDPDIVTVLIGTNDANASMVQGIMVDYVRRMKLPRDPDINWYKECLTSLIDKLKKETSAKIALISIPTIGEDSSDPAFITSMKYSKIVHEVSKETDVTYLPLYETMIERLQDSTTTVKYPFENYFGGIVKGIIKHYLFRRSWDDIASNSGFLLHVDYLHLNTEGARLITDLIVEFIKSSVKGT